VNELLIAEALHPYPPEVVIATKGGSTRGSRGEWGDDGRPEAIRRHCEGSLTRLRVDRIDLYQLHSPDRTVPIEETMGAFASLRAEGKIRHVAVSNVTVDELRRAQATIPIASVQNRYSVVDRESEPVVELCDREGIAFLPYFPLVRGSVAQAGGPLAGIAGAHAATPAQVALAWLLARSPVICPIPGTSSLTHLEENMGAAALELAPDELAALDRL
jgi:aryl-alcohol dehydrogenase-like predicted oxidoreductase